MKKNQAHHFIFYVHFHRTRSQDSHKLTLPFESYALAKVPIPSPSLPNAPNFHASGIVLHPEKAVVSTSQYPNGNVCKKKIIKMSRTGGLTEQSSTSIQPTLHISHG